MTANADESERIRREAALIAEGQAAIAAGHFIPDEELDAWLDDWMATLMQRGRPDPNCADGIGHRSSRFRKLRLRVPDLLTQRLNTPSLVEVVLPSS